MKFLWFSIAIAVAGSVFAQPPDIDPRYHTYDEVLAEVSALADTYSSICYVETLGYSGTFSLPIIAVKLSDNASIDEDESVVLIDGGQHANEPAGTETVMWLLHYLTSHYGSDTDVTRWLDSLQLWFIPVVNVDGRQIVMNESSPHSLHWRKTTRDNNENGEFDFGIDGVDPNRNYDYKWDEYDSTNWSSVNYKGPYAWSENCVVAVRDFVEHYRPAILVDLHSPDSTGGNKLWFCWFDTSLGVYHQGGFPHYLNIAIELAANTETEIDGEYYEYAASHNDRPKLQLWSYWFTGTCSIIMEITNQCFWTGDTVDTIAARVGRGLFYLFDRMFYGGLIVKAFDSESGTPLQAQVIIDGVTDTTFPARICDYHGRYHRLLYDGNYTVHIKYDTLEQVFENVPISSDSNTYIEADFPGANITEQTDNDDVNIKLLADRIIFIAPRGTVEIFDVAGHKIFEKRFRNGMVIMRNRFPEGVYFAKLSSDSKTIKKKFISIK